MQEEKIAFVQVLSLPDAELYQIKDGKTSQKARGSVQALYSRPYDLFVLRIEDFKFALVNKLEVIATRSEKEGFRSYMLPCPGGSFIIKITNLEHGILINNLDTILSNTTRFLQRRGLEEQLGGTKGGHIVEEGTTNPGGVQKIINKIAHIAMPNSSEAHSSQKVLMSFEDLKNIESTSNIVVDLSKDELQNLTDEAGEIARNHQDAGHWNDLRKEHAPEAYSTLAGTGLTSQSMSTGEPGVPQVTFPIDNTKESEKSDFDKATAGTVNKDLEIPFAKPSDKSNFINNVFAAKEAGLQHSDSLSSQKSWGSNVTNVGSEYKGMEPETSATNQFIAKSLELKNSESLSSQKSWGSNVSNAATSVIGSESTGASDLGSEFKRVNLGQNKVAYIPNDIPSDNTGDS